MAASTLNPLDNEELRALYQSIILDHGKTPRNAAKPDGANREGRGNNAMCGDKVTVHLRVDENGLVADAGFEGRGCAISIASASMMTEKLKGLRPGEARALAEAFVALVSGKPQPEGAPDLDELAAMEGVRAFPTRTKCATLAWSAMTAAIKDDPA